MDPTSCTEWLQWAAQQRLQHTINRDLEHLHLLNSARAYLQRMPAAQQPTMEAIMSLNISLYMHAKYGQ